MEDPAIPGEYKHVDRDNIPIVLERYGVPGLGGWKVDDTGKAVAYVPTGRPAMGDEPLEEARRNVAWVIPVRGCDEKP